MSKIKDFVAKNYKYWIFLLISGVVGGIFTGIYTLEITDPALIEEAIAQLGGKEIYIIISTVQVIYYALICGILGKFIAKKIGLWRELRFEGKSLVISALAGLLVGVAMMALELLWFVNVSDAVKESYKALPTVSNAIASLI